MSYIRYGSVYQYVDGTSDNYIFPTRDGNMIDGKFVEGERVIEDYGTISNETIVELIARNLEADFPEFKEYLIKKLADKLNVKLREKELTSLEAFDKTMGKSSAAIMIARQIDAVEKFSKDKEEEKILGVKK